MCVHMWISSVYLSRVYMNCGTSVWSGMHDVVSNLCVVCSVPLSYVYVYDSCMYVASGVQYVFVMYLCVWFMVWIGTVCIIMGQVLCCVF